MRSTWSLDRLLGKRLVWQLEVEVIEAIQVVIWSPELVKRGQSGVTPLSRLLDVSFLLNL